MSTLVDDYELISQFDPAVDRPAPLAGDADEDAKKRHAEAMDAFDLKWRLYLDGQGDPPLKPGAKPCVFRLRHLGNVEQKVLAKIRRQGGEDAEEACIACASMAIVGFTKPDGKELPLEFGTEKYAVFEVQHVAGASINAMGLGPGMLTEIGAVVWQRTNLRPS